MSLHHCLVSQREGSEIRNYHVTHVTQRDRVTGTRVRSVKRADRTEQDAVVSIACTVIYNILQELHFPPIFDTSPMLDCKLHLFTPLAEQCIKMHCPESRYRHGNSLHSTMEPVSQKKKE